MSKPPYRVPTMAEVRSIPHNGFNAVSTFSGTGGSCLGYRMAGFKVLWANEFIESARDSYKLNHPDSILDARDIRTVKAKDILRDIDGAEIDLFDGSPPCASFSTFGKREKNWGEEKQYSETTQKTDDLFFEYVRLIKELQPKTFVAENVSGLVKGKALGYFKQILKALKDCGYQVTCKVLDAKWLGVPQSRPRTIFVGVRNDLGIDPVHPKPFSYQYSVSDAIPWLRDPAGAPNVEPETDISGYAIGREWDNVPVGGQSTRYMSLIKPHPKKPCPCITQTGKIRGAASVVHPYEKRKFSITELKLICGFPADFDLAGDWAQQYERLGRAVPPVMMSHIASTVRYEILER